jgi:transcriptional regulator with XRE-family HTH domain
MGTAAEALVVSTAAESPGNLLRRWRHHRGLSQLRLATEAEVSARHISFLETGRSMPSRDMIVTLSEALDIPLRERNRILESAGFSALYRQTGFDAPEMAHLSRAIDLILTNHEPAGAVAVDWNWNVIKTNRAMAMVTALFVEPELLTQQPINLMRLTFAPGGLHEHVVNWEEAGRITIERIRREAEYEARPEARELLEELVASPAVESSWLRSESDAPSPLLIPLHLRKGDLELELFSTITTLGTPQDITLEELRIESFYPMNPASEATLVELTRLQ